MSSKARRPTLESRLVTAGVMMKVHLVWQKKVDELETRLRLLEEKHETPS